MRIEDAKTNKLRCPKCGNKINKGESIITHYDEIDGFSAKHTDCASNYEYGNALHETALEDECKFMSP